MYIIFAKHENKEQELCFELTSEQAGYIKKGYLLLVETCEGNAIVAATTNVICGSGARDIAEKSGAYFPLKKVISFVDENIKNHIHEGIKKSIINKLDSSNDSLKKSILSLIDSISNDDLPF